LVGVDGRIQTRNYENQQGQRVYVTEVVVDNFSLLEPKSANNNHPSQSSNNIPNPNQSNNNNNNSTKAPTADPNEDPFADNTQSIDISDDDLPF
ncbi:single-stranded DNA-binding protein, partial [Lactobacillus sp. XV13L]|nr:single-stranded DNA-binding protein [Lactobacillus sp. XV13L]